jgi:hypothetical protein
MALPQPSGPVLSALPQLTTTYQMATTTTFIVIIMATMTKTKWYISLSRFVRPELGLFVNFASYSVSFGLTIGCSTRPNTEPSPVKITTPMQFPTTQCDPAMPMHDVSKKLSSVESTVPRTGSASPIELAFL